MISKTRTMGLAGAALLAASLFASSASADVVREGAWPAEDPKVSLALGRVRREEALQKLAKAAGWSIVFTQDRAMVDEIIVDMSDVPASTALDALLMGNDWTAKREGALVRIEQRAPAAAGADPPTPPTPLARPDGAPPAAVAAPSAKKANERHRDIVVTGDSVHIAASDTVRDVTVMGGSCEVKGRVTGDLAVIGGSAHIFDGAHVEGDASAVGGSIQIDEGARVDGEVSVVGGVVLGAEHAK